MTTTRAVIHRLIQDPHGEATVQQRDAELKLIELQSRCAKSTYENAAASPMPGSQRVDLAVVDIFAFDRVSLHNKDDDPSSAMG